MTDIDFEELDKAVMSLMKGVKPDAAAVSREDKKETVLALDSPTTSEELVTAPTVTTLTPPATDESAAESVPVATPPVETPSFHITPVSTDKIDEPTVDNQSIQTVRRSGRVMDVLRTTTAPAPVMSRVSRNAAEVTPPTSTISEMVHPAASPKPITPTATIQPTEQPAPPALTMPDPIDFATASTATAPEPSAEPLSPVVEPPAGPVSETPPVETPFVPPSDYTPFIADAKVEKRPLGGRLAADESVPDGHTHATVVEPMAGQTAVPDALPPKVTPANDFPDELATNLVAIESGSAQAPADDDPIDPVTPVDDHEPETPLEPAMQIPAHVANRSEPHQPAPATVQIPQQYHEALSTGDKDHVPIYDTATLHQPLTHPVKKPTGWLWIVWIIGIMLLGAAVAALVYYFHIL